MFFLRFIYAQPLKEKTPDEHPESPAIQKVLFTSHFSRYFSLDTTLKFSPAIQF
jgi:hypothetical protein